ncbi:MAG: hypothetical protein IPN69_14465 [Acidobacteria bacterium]|nr:hypothetical protein [Acidobacteriota bacterium]MBK8811916.1 hypothetical protein [Acidobacteriota bacterium]
MTINDFSYAEALNGLSANFQPEVTADHSPCINATHFDTKIICYIFPQKLSFIAPQALRSFYSGQSRRRKEDYQSPLGRNDTQTRSQTMGERLTADSNKSQ